MSASEIDELGHVDYLVVEFPPASAFSQVGSRRSSPCSSSPGPSPRSWPDVVHLAEAMENDSVAGVVVWENSWTAPFASATPEAGGQLIAAGRIPTQAIAASIAAEVAAPGEGE
jgi:hypothetical protein